MCQTGTSLSRSPPGSLRYVGARFSFARGVLRLAAESGTTGGPEPPQDPVTRWPGLWPGHRLCWQRVSLSALPHGSVVGAVTATAAAVVVVIAAAAPAVATVVVVVVVVIAAAMATVAPA